MSWVQLRRCALAGQDKHETLETLFRNTDLSFAKTTVEGCFHLQGPGRPPRNPFGIFRTFIVMRMKGIRSLREMIRLLDIDQRLRKLCLVKTGEKAYSRSVLSRFTRKIGEENLNKIIDEKVVLLLRNNHAKEVDIVLDASFIKAWSTRHPINSQIGFSDPEARVGRTGRSYALGYKIHLSIDSKTMLPLSCFFASANDNEKKHSLTILEKAKQVLKSSGVKLRTLIADSQYSDGKIRAAVDRAVIPYPANQKPGDKSVLRVDKKFRTFGPEDQKQDYHKRPPIEAVNSFLKTQCGMVVNKVRGLRQVATYALFRSYAWFLTEKPLKALVEKTKQYRQRTLTLNSAQSSHAIQIIRQRFLRKLIATVKFRKS